MILSRFPRLALLWRFAGPRRKTLALGLMLGLMVSALGLSMPLVTQWLLESLSGSANLRDPLLLLVGLLVLSTLMSWGQWVLLGTLAENIVFDVRENMVRRFLSAKVLPLVHRPSGELVTRVTSDSVLLREAASSSFVGIINGIVMLVGTLVLMAVLDVVLMLTTVAAVVAIAIVFVLLTPAIARHQERAQGALAEMGGTLAGTLRAMKTVKAARAEHRQTGLLLGQAGRSRAHSVRALRREALLWSVAWSGIQGATIIVLGVGAWRIAEGEMTVPVLVAFLLYVFGLLDPVMELSESVTTMQAGIAAAGRIREVDDFELEPVDARRAASACAVSAVSGVPVIEFDRVTARYRPGASPAVEDFSLAVPARGHVAVVGPSGAGKTTLFSLMLRFLEPGAGSLRMDGIAYGELGTAAIRRRLAYVEQETPTLPGTLRENLLFAGPGATERQIDDVLERLRLDDMVRLLPEGLDTTLSDTSVSGGQRQRIAIARALLSEPAVLLLDEATAQVDGLSEAAIHDVIRERARSSAVVTIAHRLSTVVDADIIVVMDEARIVAQGSHRELLADSELYRQLVDSLSLGEAASDRLTADRHA